jgi:hypothetical protein
VVVVWRMGYFIPASQLCIAGRYDRPIIFPDVPREPSNSAVVSSMPPKLPPRRAARYQCLNTHCAAHFVQIAYRHSDSHHVIPLGRQRLPALVLRKTFEYAGSQLPDPLPVTFGFLALCSQILKQHRSLRPSTALLFP